MLCIVSSALPECAVRQLRQLQRRAHVLLLPPDELLPAPIRCHPDSILSVIGLTAVLPRSYAVRYPEIPEKLAEHGLTVTFTDAPRGSVYPADTALNAAVGRDFLVCRRESAAPELLRLAEAGGRRVIPVRQGYAGCSCLVTNAAVLTSDAGIARALEQSGISIRFFDSRGIFLPGYNGGFLGGCGGFADGVLVLTGRADSVPCGAELLRFAEEAGYAVEELTEEPLTDYGGIKFVGSASLPAGTVIK